MQERDSHFKSAFGSCAVKQGESGSLIDEKSEVEETSGGTIGEGAGGVDMPATAYARRSPNGTMESLHRRFVTGDLAAGATYYKL